MQWQIRTFPRCTHHVFLSHSREDHDSLVLPVYNEIRRGGIVPWIDRHDYPYGPNSREALQDSILRCRHTIFFISAAMLNSSRGWCVLELAYVNILQTNLQGRGGPYTNSILPLFFVPPADAYLPRTVWRVLRDQGVFFDNAKSENRVDWSLLQIHRFLNNEEKRACEIRDAIRRDRVFKNDIPAENGLRDRVSRFDPHSISEEIQ